MDESRLDRLERLFRAALMHAPEEREGFLEAACTDDPELRREVLSLLQSDLEAEDRSFLNRPITDLVDPDKVMEWKEEVDPEEVIGKEIGPYRILRFLGHGGMGDVFLAVREEPFRHHVALKIIRRGMDTQEVTRRFEMERQILASLSHANIARLYDGGVTVDGLPYFAMEYVDGTPITDWCDQRDMRLEDRLRLFQNVCRAVHHAHQNLIIHRDLKPTNILVTGDGLPKLLDFGIAKLLNPNLGPFNAPVTRTEFRAMTPEYASPEQVRGESLTTVSDVYSLGMILYELLTGDRPYRFVRRTSDEILSMVCELEPERPSVMVTRQGGEKEGEGKTLKGAGGRGLSPEQLQRRLRGDLDNIVLMALRKEPERRYASAEQLANDIERYLTGEPVIAHKDSRGYRIGKFIRRNRIQTISAGIILLLLIGGAVLTIYQAGRVAQERDRAQLEARRGENVTAFLVSLLRAADPAYSPTDTLTVRELLAMGAERVETELAGQPEIQGTMYDVIGNAYMNLGRYDLARPLFERGLALQRNAAEQGEGLAAALYNLARVREVLADYAGAETLFRELLDIRLKMNGRISPEYLSVLFRLGSVVHVGGRSEEANELFEEWQGLYDRLESKSHPELIPVMFGMADVCFARREYAEAEAYIREILDLRRRMNGAKHPDIGSALNVLASIQVSEGKNDEAERTIREALALHNGLYPEGHQSTASSVGILATILQQQKRYVEAEQAFRQAIDLHGRISGADHHNTALARAHLGRLYVERKRYADAEKLYREAERGYANFFGEENLMTILLRKELAEALIAAGKKEEGKDMLSRDYAALLRQHGPDNPTTQSFREMLDRLAAAD